MDTLTTKRLESNRLILRKFTLDDAEGMYNNWGSDPECCKYLAWDVHKSVDETKALLQSWVNDYENGALNWVVELKETGEIIGSISVMELLKKQSTAAIGYCYGSKFWGNGYATEALRTVLEYLLNDCGIYLVEARHISGNPASGRVMEKAGMRKDGVLRSRRINKHTKERNDAVVYSIIKDEL